MQVAKKEVGQANAYITVMEKQPILMHTRTPLDKGSEWVLYKEFILIAKNYICTLTKIEPEWLLVSRQ